MFSRLCYINMCMASLIVSFGAQLIAFAAPGWLNVTIETSIFYDQVYSTVVSQNFALWYLVICWNGTCLTKPYDRLSSGDDQSSNGKDKFEDRLDQNFTARYSRFPFPRLLEFQIETACALVLILMGLIMMRKQKKSFELFIAGKSDEEPRQSRFCMVFCYAVISGALILVPTSTFIDVNEDLRVLSDNYEVDVPYALICAGAGGLLALLSCLLIVATMCKLILSEDEYGSGNLSVAVHDGVNANNQLVPLVDPKAQTSTGGYTQSVSTNSTNGSIRKKTVAFKSTVEVRGGKDKFKKRDGDNGCNRSNGSNPSNSSHVIINTHAVHSHSPDNTRRHTEHAPSPSKSRRHTERAQSPSKSRRHTERVQSPSKSRRHTKQTYSPNHTIKNETSA
ncbi:uncharacterized protein LOC132738650 [Ruditapes philippinarum]|uniref:uncharacterized protein LOC132738650 n=1 Tax=Ruditapes philippinarum TaxID=129788 RepID=UPI00295B9B75|nr:uncharacterized protein LOC132738650 [Ruditapes philippinarum]